MLKLSLLILTLFPLAASANDTEFRQRITRVKDVTTIIVNKPDLYAGKPIDTVKAYMKSYKPSQPFMMSFQEKEIVGKNKYGNIILAADVYFVNPNKTSGMLMWSAPEHHVLEEPEWTKFKVDGVDLKESHVKALKKLLDI